MARKETAIWVAQRGKILKFIESECATTVEIAAGTGIGHSTVKVHLSEFRTAGMIHVGDWEWRPGSTRATRRYVAGEGKDAPYPVRTFVETRRPRDRSSKIRRDWAVAALFGEYQGARA